ncbi:MAG TPA: DUF4965 domain-containing protein [Firmicutes bacterium]|nr:DUF4965 domain-containing protein [Bacillota bacterium]
MHDIGWVTDCDTMRYHHHMPVEENTNYILMSYAYWKRTGDKSLIVKHKDTIVKALRFLELSDTTGNGVPDEGMSNTIDDASPALQFGKEQVYLAVKTLAAFWASCEMLEGLVESDQLAKYFLRARKILQRLHEQGWKDDHFVTVLDPAYEGVYDAWSQEFIPGPLPGWDAAHIYTTNGLVLLDMVGASLGLDHRKICQDLQVALERCLVKYGCCHSDYFSAQEDAAGEGGNIMGNKRGWISMNVARDITAFYRGLDFSHLCERYWEFQVVTNTQGPHLFFESFNGNNLMTYPRGVAIFGYYDAMAGLFIDVPGRRLGLQPLHSKVKVPVLLYADWDKGICPMVENGELRDPHGLLPDWVSPL